MSDIERIAYYPTAPPRPATPARWRLRFSKQRLISVATVVIVIVAWSIATRLQLISPVFLPSPAADCATDVPGLYAAGDAASRETIVGGRTGGGSPNSAWAIVTGAWAGAAASAFARRQGARMRAGMEEISLAAGDLSRQVIEKHVWPLRTNLFRHATGLTPAIDALDNAWREPAGHAAPLAEARSARAMLYVARLAYRSALRRTESRALHRRSDCPECSEAMRYRLVIGGVDTFTFSTDAVAA